MPQQEVRNTLPGVIPSDVTYDSGGAGNVFAETDDNSQPCSPHISSHLSGFSASNAIHPQPPLPPGLFSPRAFSLAFLKWTCTASILPRLNPLMKTPGRGFNSLSPHEQVGTHKEPPSPQVAPCTTVLNSHTVAPASNPRGTQEVKAERLRVQGHPWQHCR